MNEYNLKGLYQRLVLAFQKRWYRLFKLYSFMTYTSAFKKRWYSQHLFQRSKKMLV